MNTDIKHPTLPKSVYAIFKTCFCALGMAVMVSGCTVLSVADAAVSGTISVVSTGVSAATSVVKAVIPSGKEAAK